MAKIKWIGAVLLMAGLSACSTVAPKYNSNFDNVAALRSQQLRPIKVGDVSKEQNAKTNINKLTIRGGDYASPYGSFTAYLQNALKQELDDARLLDSSSDLQITAVLLKNQLDASGASRAYAAVEARFVVKDSSAVKYDSVKSARYEWDSSFAGNVAIPKANQNYPVVMQRLLTSLFTDPAFIAAIKK
jgi:hypothetical protein